MNFIINETESQKSLEKAKILILSDSHFQKQNLLSAIEKAPSKIDAVFFLGDGIQDFIEIMEEDFLNEEKILPQNIYIVRGNGDDFSYSIYTDKNETIEFPKSEVVTICGKKLFLCHGNEFQVYFTLDILLKELKNLHAKAGFFGHTHVPFYDKKSDILLLNPGSVSRPRNYSNKSFVILELNKKDNEIKVTFDSIE